MRSPRSTGCWSGNRRTSSPDILVWTGRSWSKAVPDGARLLRKGIQDSHGENRVTAASLARLEARREDWALRMQCTAHVLKDAKKVDWRTLPGRANADLHRRTLQTIPIMEIVSEARYTALLTDELAGALPPTQEHRGPNHERRSCPARYTPWPWTRYGGLAKVRTTRPRTIMTPPDCSPITEPSGPVSRPSGYPFGEEVAPSALTGLDNAAETRHEQWVLECIEHESKGAMSKEQNIVAMNEMAVSRLLPLLS